MSTKVATKLMQLLVLIALAGLGPATSALANRTASKQPPVRLHLRFHRAGTGGDVLTDGRYVFVGAKASIMGPIGTVIDQQTGKRSEIPQQPGCRVGAAVPLGGPWFLFDCASTAELYSLAHGTLTTIVPNPALDCGGLPDCEVTAVAAGADWIEFGEHQACEAHCGATTFAFQNLQTGQVQSLPGWHPGGTTIPDLNSPALAHELCPPLQVPQGEGLTLDGSFAIAAQPHGNFLERCGSRLHQRIDPDNWPQAESSRAVIWSTGTRQMDGLFLPSRRRFTINLPAAIAGFDGLSYEIALSSRTLYVTNYSNVTLWTAPFPNRPPGTHS